MLRSELKSTIGGTPQGFASAANYALSVWLNVNLDKGLGLDRSGAAAIAYLRNLRILNPAS